MGEKKKQSGVLSEDSETLEKLNAELKRDLEERMRMERSLRESEKRYRTILETIQENSPDIISDTGPGIDLQNMNRIFDPFFTTKDRSEGTGLGLFLSYGIVKDHGGRIWAENNDGGGASFFVQLPVVAQKDSKPSRVEPHPEGGKTSPQKVMEK